MQLRRVGWLREAFGFRRGQREPHPEPRVAGDRLYLEVPVVLVDHDAPGDVEPESGALTHRLGREERLEDPGADVFRHAGGRGRGLHDNPGAGPGPARGYRFGASA